VVAALIGPTLTASPPSPLAEVGGPSFAAPGSGAQLPLLLTAIGAQFAGDATTTEQGGTISLTPDGSLRMTLNNSALGVSGVPLSIHPTSIAGGTIQSFIAPSGTDHVRSGAWFIRSGGVPIGGVWTTGFSTPQASIPTTSNFDYTGTVAGLISEYHVPGGDGVGLLSGDVNFTVNFATQKISGEISNLRVGSDGLYVTGPVNLLSFTATINPGTNSYTGEVVSAISPGGPNAFQVGTKGTISGQFFGPGATESGAVLTLSDGTSRLIISFSASDFDRA